MTSGRLIDLIGLAGAALTTLCWLPQMAKAMRERDTRALSLPGTAAFTAGIALCWSMAWRLGTGR